MTAGGLAGVPGDLTGAPGILNSSPEDLARGPGGLTGTGTEERTDGLSDKKDFHCPKTGPVLSIFISICFSFMIKHCDYSPLACNGSNKR